MNERFKQILEEATKQVKQWPEWKKSDELKRSERELEPGQDRAAQSKSDESRTNSAAAAK